MYSNTFVPGELVSVIHIVHLQALLALLVVLTSTDQQA